MPLFFKRNGYKRPAQPVSTSSVAASLPSVRLISPAPPTAPSDGSQPSFPRPIAEFDDELWRLGWVDGRLGQPSAENEDLLKAEAELTRREKLEEIERRIAETRSWVERERDLAARCATSLEKALRALDEILIVRSQKLQHYSMALGLAFLVVGAVLFLSDIPLSLRLVAEGYDIPTDTRLPDGTRLRIAEVLIRPIAVLQYLWEPLALAIGIAFSGVFVKIFIDEVIWRDSSDERPPRKLVVFLSSVAILFLFTLIAVGVFRSQQQAQRTSSGGAYLPDWSSGTQSAPSGNGAPVSWSWNQSQMAQQGAPSPGPGLWNFLSFLSLTLMLPIIGGISFVAGWSRIQRWHYYRECRKRVRNAQETYSLVTNHLASHLGDLAGLEIAAENLKKEDPRVIIRQRLYRHGYQRGTGVPETLRPEDNLYERCDHLLEKQLSAQARKKFWATAESRGASS